MSDGAWQGTRSVDLLVFAAVQLLDVTGPLQVFTSANDHVRAQGGAPAYVTRVVAQGGGPVTSTSGLAIVSSGLPPASARLHTLIVAGGDGVEAASRDEALLGWMRGKAAQSQRVACVCTGAFLLAATGLLDGRRAVTHWSRCGDLARRHPAVRVDPEPIFVQDGRFWTSAGVTSGIDLALALVEADLGRAVALAVARYLVMFLKRPGGQAQFSAMLAAQAADAPFAALHLWIGDHLADTLTLAALARAAGMSARTFSRRYVAETGMTPARAVERLRVEAARRLLSDTALPAKRIAQRCGFGSEETLRRSFLRLLGTTPAAYRARF